jgi:two-component system LytT family response regulator
VIVDDESLARERVRELLRDEPDVEIVAECDGGRQAVEAVRSHRPDLLFLDVQMPEVDGFDVLRELDGEEDLPNVVFVTAYDEYAVQAFDAHALDYLLKPFREERLRSAVERARTAIARRAQDMAPGPLQALLGDLKGTEAPDHLVVRSPGKIRFVPVGDVDWIEAAGNYVMIHAGKDSHLMRETMIDLERRLDPELFLRTHRGALVAVDRIREIRLSSSGDGRVLLRSGAEVPLSRRFRKRLDERFGD